MIENFDDFCLWMYVMVDDIWQQIEPLFKRPGPAAECSDSELLTMALVGECREWDTETTLLSQGSEHRDLFFFFSSRRRHTRFDCDWSSDVCSSDLQWPRSAKPGGKLSK